jgi:hypothetical protein
MVSRRPCTIAALVLAGIALLLGGSVAGPEPVRAADAPCEGDECQPPAPAPDDPTPGTAVVEGPPNPPVHFPKPRGGKKQGHKKHHHKKRHHASKRGRG